MKYFNFVLLLVLLSVGLVSLGFAGKVGADIPTQKVVQGKQSVDPMLSDILGTPKAMGQRVTDLSAGTPVIKTQSVGAGSAMINGLGPGPYTIPGDFPSLEAFAAVLNFVGLSDNTVVELTGTTYLEDPVVFGPHPGQDDYTVTIAPSVGNNVTVQFKSTIDNGKGFAFVGAKNIIIDGKYYDQTSSLNLEWADGYPFPTSDGFGATIFITGGSSFIIIKNLDIQGWVNTPNWIDQTDGRAAIFIWNPDTDAATNHDITIDGCTITHATYGIKSLLGENWINIAYNLNILNNRIGGAYGDPVVVGSWWEVVANVNYIGNIVDGSIYLQEYWYNNTNTEYDQDEVWGYPDIFYYFGQSTGGHFLLVDEGIFSDNIHRNVTSNGTDGDGLLTYGTRVYGYPLGFGGSGYRPKLYDNRFYNLSNGDSYAGIYGIRGPGIDVYHSSVRLSGTVSGGGSSCLNGATYVYNSAFSNEIVGQAPASCVGVTAGATFDYDAIYSTGRFVSGYPTVNQIVQAGINVHGAFGPINFDPDLHITTGPSTAENIASPAYITIAGNDIDDEARDLNAPDAGADEFPTLPNSWGPDVFPAGIPIAASIPTGLPQTPNVTVKNNTSSPITNVSVNLTIAPDGYNENATIASIPAGGTAIAAFPAWTPATSGPRTMTATTTLSGDVDPSNDTFIGGTTVSDPIPIVGSVTYTWDASDEGWTRAIDWVRSSTFTKLGGPYSGASMVTERPNLISTYTEGAYASSQGYSTTYPGANLLTSPWLDLSGLGGTDVYISFYLSIALEPDWDMGWMEYTVDGVNWKHLGVLNDPNGVNWYNENVYEYALSDDASGNVDEATLILYGLINNGNTTLPFPRWASNGTDVPTGPLGYVFNQLKATATEYPDLVGAPVIKFRFVAFSDAATAADPGGWAIDNFYIGSTGATFTGGSITGTVFHDVNGNGVNDGEPAEGNVDIDVTYFGVPVTTIQTNSLGQYTFDLSVNGGLPGNYELIVQKPGYAFTLPFGSSKAIINHPSDGSTLTQDFGTYQGSISGVKFSDFDDDGSDIEAGDQLLSGWTIEVHMDTPTGPLMGSAVTGVNGEYTIPVPPYATYIVTEVPIPTTGRQTFPLGGSHTVAISGNSGSGTAIVTDKNFGNFIYGKWTIEVTVDRNGNGIRDAADFVPLPFGTDFQYNVYKDNSLLETITLGSGNSLNIRSQLDVGTYAVARVTDIPAGWIQTTFADSIAFDIATSGYNDTTNFLYFKLVKVSGKKFDDTNGNGVQDAGELGLEGWTINVSGTGGGSQVTGPDGSYEFTTIGPGVHDVTETMQSGWVATSGPFNFTAASADLPANNKVYNFGNFKTVCISGVKFRDRNNNGVKDPGEEGLAGWTINMTGQTPVVTNDDGEFEFCNIGPGTFTLTEDAQTGWVLTVPASGEYEIVTESGVDVTGLIFGNFKEGDTTKFRTFTYAQLATDLKKNKTPKVGKPILAPPNMANLLEQLMLEGAAPLVGLENVTDPLSGKVKPYLKPKKYGDIIKTFNVKGTLHTGTPKGFDVDNKGKMMLKLWKSMPPTKANNLLTAELLTLQVNLYASQLGHTPAGLGSLMYTWPGILNGMTIDEIADYANEIMTNWVYVPKANYDSLYNAVKRINEAFANTVVTDTVQGWFPLIPAKPYSHSTWAAYKTVYEIEFLKANPGVAPRVRPTVQPDQLPVVFELGQNYPNPFNPTTTIEFSLPVDAFVTLKVYNLLGQEVATLLDREPLYSGDDYVDFDASQLASGVYLYRIVAEAMNDDEATTGEVFTQVKKMVLMK